ncbi:MAG: hypothetical protein ACI9LE_001951 [Paraglaciecola sp.]
MIGVSVSSQQDCSEEQKNAMPHAELSPLKTLGLIRVFVSVEIVDIHHTCLVDFFIKYRAED